MPRKALKHVSVFCRSIFSFLHFSVENLSNVRSQECNETTKITDRMLAFINESSRPGMKMKFIHYASPQSWLAWVSCPCPVFSFHHTENIVCCVSYSTSQDKMTSALGGTVYGAMLPHWTYSAKKRCLRKLMECSQIYVWFQLIIVLSFIPRWCIATKKQYLNVSGC